VGAADDTAARNEQAHAGLWLTCGNASQRPGWVDRPAPGTAMSSAARCRPGDRVDSLVDPSSPLLELSPLAPTGMYGDEVPAAKVYAGRW
jgi:3-methylcrotonyl-CoA carboxylase beta subunit